MSTATHNYTGVNMFDSKSTSRLFVEMVEVIEREQGSKTKEVFVQHVKEVFDEKITSEDGVHSSFKVTALDLKFIAQAYV